MNCPVCGVKIKAWDWKQNCRKCGTNLFLHDFNKRLETESVQAEKDFQWWTNMTDQFMNYGVRDKLSLSRLISSVLPLILLCMPVLEYGGNKMMYINYLLDSFGGGKFFPEGFGIGEMTQYACLLPAFLLLFLSLFLATVGFFSVIVGPAFMNFKAPACFESIGAVLAVVGTVLFNFCSVPSFSVIDSSAKSSFGLYIYCGVMIAEALFNFLFIGYSKKFKPLQK